MHAADAFLTVEEEEIQEIAEHQSAGFLVVKVGRRELLRRRSRSEPFAIDEQIQRRAR